MNACKTRMQQLYPSVFSRLRVLSKYKIPHSYPRENLLTCLIKNSQCWRHRLNCKINVITEEFARQMSGIASLRLRRSIRVVDLTSKLGYDTNKLLKIFHSSGTDCNRKLLSRLTVFAAAVFCWDENRITDEEVEV